jgi:hypothetical protein
MKSSAPGDSRGPGTFFIPCTSDISLEKSLFDNYEEAFPCIGDTLKYLVPFFVVANATRPLSNGRAGLLGPDLVKYLTIPLYGQAVYARSGLLFVATESPARLVRRCNRSAPGESPHQVGLVSNV